MMVNKRYGEPKEELFSDGYVYRFYLGRFKCFKGKVFTVENEYHWKKFYDETNGSFMWVKNVEGVINGNDVWFKEPNLKGAVQVFQTRENVKIEKAKQKIAYYQSQIKLLDEIEASGYNGLSAL